MAASLQVIEVNDMGGGVNTYNRPTEIGSQEIQDTSRNVRASSEFCFQRAGFITWQEQLAGNATTGTRLVAPYFRQNDSDDLLVMVYDNEIYVNSPSSPSTWTQVVQNFMTSDSVVDGYSFFDWFFILNGVDKPIMLTGTTATQPFIKPDSIASANDFTPAFGEIYLNKQCVSGVPSLPNSVFISKTSSTQDMDFIYDFSGTIATGIADANEIVLDNRVTAMRKLSTALVIFTVDGAWYMSGFREVDNGIEPVLNSIGGAEGAASQAATVVVENDIFYITPHKEIRSVKRSLANSEAFDTSSLSRKIQSFLTSKIDDDLSSAFGLYDSKSQEVMFFLRLKGEVNNFVRLVGNMERLDKDGSPAWFIDDNMSFASGCFYRNTRFLGDAVVGQVYEDGVGTADDDDAAIQSQRVSKDFVGDSSLKLKNFKGVDLFYEITQSTVMYIDIYVDDVLITTETIDISNNLNNSQISGIGTQEVGNFEIGDEGEDITPYEEDYIEGWRRVPIRKRGHKLTIVNRADGNTNAYRLRAQHVYFVPIATRQYSLQER